MSAPLSPEALRQMRRYAERCDAQDGRCKSCTFLLTALDEITRLMQPTVRWVTPVVGSDTCEVSDGAA